MIQNLTGDFVLVGRADFVDFAVGDDEDAVGVACERVARDVGDDHGGALFLELRVGVLEKVGGFRGKADRDGPARAVSDRGEDVGILDEPQLRKARVLLPLSFEPVAPLCASRNWKL